MFCTKHKTEMFGTILMHDKKECIEYCCKQCIDENPKDIVCLSGNTITITDIGEKGLSWGSQFSEAGDKLPTTTGESNSVLRNEKGETIQWYANKEIPKGVKRSATEHDVATFVITSKVYPKSTPDGFILVEKKHLEEWFFVFHHWAIADMREREQKCGEDMARYLGKL